MKTATDLNTNQIYKVFDMLDVDGSGAMDFDEFYLLICILIAVQDKVEKNFIYRHSRTVFNLLDENNTGNTSAYEFETFGFLKEMLYEVRYLKSSKCEDHILLKLSSKCEDHIFT